MTAALLYMLGALLMHSWMSEAFDRTGGRLASEDEAILWTAVVLWPVYVAFVWAIRLLYSGYSRFKLWRRA